MITGKILGVAPKVAKTDPIVIRLYKWVTEQYENGRITIISDDELKEQYKKIVE